MGDPGLSPLGSRPLKSHSMASPTSCHQSMSQHPDSRGTGDPSAPCPTVPHPALAWVRVTWVRQWKTFVLLWGHPTLFPEPITQPLTLPVKFPDLLTSSQSGLGENWQFILQSFFLSFGQGLTVRVCTRIGPDPPASASEGRTGLGCVGTGRLNSPSPAALSGGQARPSENENEEGSRPEGLCTGFPGGWGPGFPCRCSSELGRAWAGLGTPGHCSSRSLPGEKPTSCWARYG